MVALSMAQGRAGTWPPVITTVSPR